MLFSVFWDSGARVYLLDLAIVSRTVNIFQIHNTVKLVKCGHPGDWDILAVFPGWPEFQGTPVSQLESRPKERDQPQSMIICKYYTCNFKERKKLVRITHSFILDAIIIKYKFQYM